jgi:type I restriction enzyme, S subunit
MQTSKQQHQSDQWIQVQLGQCGELYCGQSPSVAEVNADGRGEPYFTGPEQWDGQTLHVDKWTEHPKRLVPEGCIFITVKGAGVGTIFPGMVGAIGRDIYAFHVHKELDYQYVFYALKFTIDQIIRKAQGDIPGLSKAHILDHEIGLPGIEQQRRIVARIEELFSELDDGIESLRKVREQLKVYRQALLRDAFEGKLTARWRDENGNKIETSDQLLARIEVARETRYQQQLEEWRTTVQAWEAEGAQGAKPRRPAPCGTPSKITSDEAASLPSIPDGWRFVRLSEIAQIGSGMSVSASRPIEDPVEVPYLRVANVQRGFLNLSEIKSMKIERSQLPGLRLKKWDVLFNEGGDRDKLGSLPAVTRSSKRRAGLWLRCGEVRRPGWFRADVRPALCGRHAAPGRPYSGSVADGRLWSGRRLAARSRFAG